MNHTPLLRKLSLSIAMLSACGLGMAQSNAPVAPATSPTITQTVKPGSGNEPSMGMAGPKKAVSSTITDTVKPASSDQPGMTPGPGMKGAGKAVSPTITQTVKPMSRSARARHQRRMARMHSAKTEQTGSGSAGTVAGRVEGSTFSNSDGKAPKAP